MFKFSILPGSADESVSNRAAEEQDLYPQPGIIWSPTGKLKQGGKIWKLPKPWPCFSSKSPVQWRLYLHCISALPVILVSAKNNSNTDFPRVISLRRIRLRLDCFLVFFPLSCFIKFKSRYLPYEKAVSVSPYCAVWSSVSLAALWDHTQLSLSL